MSNDDNITMTRAQWDALQRHMADLERSAASAREIARVAMQQTKSRCMRVEVVVGDGGINVIVCDPAGDEMATTKKLVGLLDRALWSMIGVEFSDKDPIPVGSTA